MYRCHNLPLSLCFTGDTAIPQELSIREEARETLWFLHLSAELRIWSRQDVCFKNAALHLLQLWWGRKCACFSPWPLAPVSVSSGFLLLFFSLCFTSLSLSVLTCLFQFLLWIIFVAFLLFLCLYLFPCSSVPSVIFHGICFLVHLCLLLFFMVYFLLAFFFFFFLVCFCCCFLLTCFCRQRQIYNRYMLENAHTGKQLTHIEGLMYLCSVCWPSGVDMIEKMKPKGDKIHIV